LQSTGRKRITYEIGCRYSRWAGDVGKIRQTINYLLPIINKMHKTLHLLVQIIRFCSKGFYLISKSGLPTVLMALPGNDSGIGEGRMSSQRYSPERKDESYSQIWCMN